MGRAGGLAGGGAGVVAVDPVVVPVVSVPAILAPDVIVGQVADRVFHPGAVGLAELLAQLGGAGGADLHALAAGHALFLVHVGPIGGPGHVGGVEELAGAKAVAAAGGAVADAHDAVGAVQVGDLVDVALALRPLDDLHGLLPGDVVGVLAGLHQELRDVAHADAHVALDVAHALAPDALGLAAGADHGAEGVVLLKPVGEMLHADALAGRVDGLLHGDHVHADAGPAGGHQLGRHFEGLLGGQVEHGGHLGMLVGQRLMLHHVFAGAHHPLGDAVLDVLVRIVPVLLHDADPDQMVDDLLGGLFGDAVLFGQPFGGPAHPALLEAQHEPDLVLGEEPIQDPEIHMVFLHAAGELPGDVVRDHEGQLLHQLGLLRVAAMVAVHGIVPLVHVDAGVHFFYHVHLLTRWGS